MPQVVCSAIGSPDLATWTKPAQNPVIDGPPRWLRAACAGDFRDPFVWRAGDGWHLIIASHIANVGGCVLHYRSPDLVQWEDLGVLLNGDARVRAPVWTGTIWECPNLLDFGDRQALIISTQGQPNELMYAFYHTGQLRGATFHPNPPRILAHGPAGEALYAPQVTRLADGRYLLFGWLREGRSAAQCVAAGWSGVMSLPLLVTVRPDGALALQPDPALQQLRDRHWRFTASDLAAGHDALLPDVTGDCLEIVATFAPDNAGEYGLKLRCAPDGREFTRLSVASARRTITIEREHASLDAAAHRDGCTAALLAAPGEPVTLHIFLDRSVIELFADDGHTLLTSRIYPTLAESQGVALFSHGGAARLLALDIWSLRSIW